MKADLVRQYHRGYASRVTELEEEGLCTSDAQGIADLEFMKLAAVAPKLLGSLSRLLEVINIDRDGAYFICEEGKPYVDAAVQILKEAKENLK